VLREGGLRFTRTFTWHPLSLTSGLCYARGVRNPYLLGAAEALARNVPFWALVAVAACVNSAGCAHPVDAVIYSLDGAQATLTATHDVLEMRLDADRKAVVASAATKADAEKAVADVEKKYARAWDAYRRARTAWVIAASLTRAAQIADASGSSPSLAAAKKAADEASTAMSAMGASLEATK